MNRAIAILSLLLALSTGWIFFEKNQLDEIKNQQGPTKPQFGGTYVRAILDDPTTMDPAFVTDTTAAEIVAQVYSRLFRMDSNQKPTPDLAKSYSVSSDEKIYTLSLKEKVRFHTITEKSTLSANHGREVTSGDVKFSMERLLSPEMGSPHQELLGFIEGSDAYMDGSARGVSGIRILSKYRLEIHLKNPYSPFLAILTTPALSIVPREDALHYGKSFGQHPVGSGAFIFERYIAGEEVVLRANLDFHLGRPYLERIRFRIVKSDLEQYELFRQGRIHHVTQIPAHKLKDSIKKGRYRFLETSSLETTYLGMNVNMEPFNQKLVRQALNFAVNKRLLVKYIKNNHGMVAKGPLPPEVPGYSHGVEPYPFQLAKARELLIRAGYSFDDRGMVTDFPELTLQTGLSEDARAAAAAVQANLADLGIHLRLKFVSLSDHYQSIDAGTAPFFSLGWIADYPDADNILWYNFHSRNAGLSNSSRYANPEVDQLLEEARTIGNSEKRSAIYQQVESRIVEDAPWIFLYYPTTYFLMQPWVHGLENFAFGAAEVDYYHVWLSPEPASSI